MSLSPKTLILGKAAFSQTGMEQAVSITKALEVLQKSGVGGYAYGTPRKPEGKRKLTNRQVMEFLKMGGRDITLSEKDVHQAAEIFVKKETDFLRRLSGKKGKTKIVSTDRARLQGAVSAMKAALIWGVNLLSRRIKQQRTNDGDKADPVSEEYAQRRKAKRGVNEDVVFVNTGQLANAIFDGRTKITTKRTGGGILSGVKSKLGI
jgi:hypothetical protein